MLIPDNRLAAILDSVSALPGDYAEVGVYKGHTFRRLVTDAAKRGNVIAHGFDSFAGMDEPTNMDGPNYPKGRLSCGGIAWFQTMMRRTGLPASAYRLHQGFVPKCFDTVSDDQRFRFALVDVDQYAPTIASLEWLWPRMTQGGIVVCDDYFANAQRYASAGIDAWLKTTTHKPRIVEHYASQLVLEATA